MQTNFTFYDVDRTPEATIAEMQKALPFWPRTAENAREVQAKAPNADYKIFKVTVIVEPAEE